MAWMIRSDWPAKNGSYAAVPPPCPPRATRTITNPAARPSATAAVARSTRVPLSSLRRAISRRSAGQEREADPAVRVVAVEVDEHQALPRPERQAPLDDRDHQRRAHEHRQQVVGAVAG